MMSLFSSFDLNITNYCFIILFTIFATILKIYSKVSFVSIFLNKFYSIIFGFTLPLKSKMYTESTLNLILSFFIMIFFLNFTSVFSFFFPLTSQMSIVLFMSLSLWLSFFIYQVAKNMKGFVSHCIPEGAPIYLVSLLFLIELVSNSIRPITLTVRLAANILAGHLLMILLSNLALDSFLGSLAYTFLNIVELFVAAIQAYIFVTMCTLYFSDVN